jgi:2-polyprenyl-3-methyl-5-hydroxy-6-metoxy-1,4-benzoquinol methylase
MDDAAYTSGLYRRNLPYDGGTLPGLVRDRLKFFMDRSIDGKTVLDMGAGNGLFLDVMKNLGAITYFTEVNEQQADLLALRHGNPRGVKHADYITIFDVIEHVKNPRFILEFAKAWMHSKSKLLLSTPRTAEPIYAPSWFYRTHHRWYFNERSLRMLADRCDLRLHEEFVLGIHDNATLYQAYTL